MPPRDQLPAIIRPGELATPSDTYIVPALIADLGHQANWRYVEFFTANINNDHTRRAYARACSRFFAWCENPGLSITAIRPFDVAAWVKELQQTHGAPGVKQQLAAVRMLFDWLITGQIVPMNSAAAVRGPKHVVKTGKTPVLEGEEWRKLLASIPTTTLRDLRDRALRPTPLQLRAHRCGLEDEGRGSAAARRRMDGPAARERRQGTRDAVPSRARRGLARLHRRGWHRRGPEGLPVPHRARAQSRYAVRARHEPVRRLVHDPPPGQGGRHHGADRLPYVSCNRHHRLSRQWRRARACAGNGRARKPAHDQAL